MAFLTEVSGFSIADDLLGEEPSVPLPLGEISRESASVDLDPVVVLSKALLQTSSMILDADTRAHLSEQVVQYIVWSVVVWSETYLISSEVTTPKLMATFGDNSNGHAVVQQFCAVANTCLTSFPTNQALQQLVCSRLLKALTRSKEIRKHVVECPSWGELMAAFSNLCPVFLQAQHKSGRHIAFALCVASDAFDEEPQRTQYLRQLLEPVGREAQRLAGGGRRSVHASYLIEILRGITQSTRTIPDTRKTIYAFFEHLFQPLVESLSVFDDDENFTCAVLKLAAEVVEAHVLFLDDSDTERLLDWSLKMLRVFSSRRRGVQPLEVSEELLKEKQHEQCKDIRAMLLLLKNITDRELAAEDNNLDIAKIVVEGIHLTIPLMSTELLKFPKLCFQYFDLLSHLCEVYPEKIAELPSSSLEMLMSTLSTGLELPETRVLRIVLESLESLAKHLWTSLKQNRAPFAQNLFPGRASFASFFIHRILQRLLQSEEGGDAVAAAAATLLLLLSSEQSNASGILRDVVASVGTYPSVDADIQTLLHFSEGTEFDPLSSKTHDSFRERLGVFIRSARRLTRTH